MQTVSAAEISGLIDQVAKYERKLQAKQPTLNISPQQIGKHNAAVSPFGFTLPFLLYLGSKVQKYREIKWKYQNPGAFIACTRQWLFCVKAARDAAGFGAEILVQTVNGNESHIRIQIINDNITPTGLTAAFTIFDALGRGDIAVIAKYPIINVRIPLSHSHRFG